MMPVNSEPRLDIHQCLQDTVHAIPPMIEQLIIIIVTEHQDTHYVQRNPLVEYRTQRYFR